MGHRGSCSRSSPSCMCLRYVAQSRAHLVQPVSQQGEPSAVWSTLHAPHTGSKGGGGGDVGGVGGDVGGEGGNMQMHCLDEEHEVQLPPPKTQRLRDDSTGKTQPGG